MTDLRPLALYPWPLPDTTMGRVRDAFRQGGWPFAVQPVQAVPGGPTRVLSFDGVPPWVCDAAPVMNGDEAALQRALEWVLDETQDVERGYSVKKYLDGLLGPGVKEITHDWDNWDAEGTW